MKVAFVALALKLIRAKKIQINSLSKRTWKLEKNSEELESVQDLQHAQEREDDASTENALVSDKQLFTVDDHRQNPGSNDSRQYNKHETFVGEPRFLLSR